MAENKVVYGLKNCHYSVITEDEGGNHTYAVPIPIKGATEISLDPRGKLQIFMRMIRFITQQVQMQDMKQP